MGAKIQKVFKSSNFYGKNFPNVDEARVPGKHKVRMMQMQCFLQPDGELA